MSREIKHDFNVLLNFLQEYDLKGIAANPHFQKNLSQLHKRYLALLTLLAELQQQRELAINDLSINTLLPDDNQIGYLREAGSDLGQVLFCWMHGAYKGGKTALRSSIETFVKGVACREQPVVLIETRLYKVFEIANTTSFFSSSLGSSIFNDLNSFYGQLSSDVHTATAANMNKISALSYFPAYDKIMADKMRNMTVSVTSQVITALTLQFNDAFHQMHHRNKEIILEAVPGKFKRAVQNV